MRTLQMSSWDDDDYDNGSEDSGKSRDWDMEPGDPGWLGEPDEVNGED